MNKSQLDIINLKQKLARELRMDPYGQSIEPSLIVFLAVLVRFGYTQNIKEIDGKTKEWIYTAVSNKSGAHPEIITEIYKCFESSFNSISEQTLFDFIVGLKVIQPLSNEQFCLHIEALVKIATDDLARTPHSFDLPDGLANLMYGIANLGSNEKIDIYNPFSSIGDLLVNSYNNANFIAQEYDKINWAVSVLRILASGDSANANILNEDPIGNWSANAKKYDLILSVPPFGLKIGERQTTGKFGYFRSIEHFIVERGIESLKQEGRLIITIPQGFLFNSDNYSRQLKQFLVDQNYLEAVINLPKGIFSFTNILTTVLVIHKSNKPKKVKFIDGTSFIKKVGKLNTVDYLNILRVYGENETSKNQKIATSDEIAGNDYNLTVNRYVAEAVEGTLLKELVSTYKGERNFLPRIGKVIKIKDLKTDIADFTLDLNVIESSETTNRHRQINHSCVLIAARFKSCKPTYFHYQGEAIYIDNNVFAIIPNEEKLRIDYFIYLLHTSKVVSQIESLQSGAVTPFISVHDFQKVKVDLPNYNEQNKNFEEQDKIVKEAIANNLDKLSLSNSLINEIEQNRLKYNEELREKQHCIRQHLKNVVDSISVINSFMAKQNGTISNDDVINPNRNVTVAQRFEAMSNSIRSLSLEIDNLTNDELYDNQEQLGIRDLLAECILEFGDTKGFSIQENIDELTLEEFGDTNPKIAVSKRSFKELFNNILMNASTHGFVESKDYTIKINVTIEDEKLKLSFLNNGKPFAEGMSKQLGVKGKKAGINSGSGIGVWKVFEIAKHYNFDCKVIDMPEDEYPVGWDFKFTLIDKN
jgi:type I restriction enzyme M protein